MDEKSRKPKIRFAGFTEDWEQLRLGDCVQIQRGGSPRPIEKFITDNENGINWVKIGDVAEGSRYITSTKEKIKPEGEKYSRRVYVGDLVLSNSMSFGRPYIMKINGCIHDGWLLIRNEKNIFNIEYLLQLLSSSYTLKQYKSLASGGVVNNLNSELVQSTTALLPPIDEQQKIGTFFRHLDHLITLHQRKRERLVNIKKAMLEKMFPKKGADVPEVRFAGFTEAWEQRKAKDLGRFSKGCGYSKADLIPNGTPVILYGRLYTNYQSTISEVDTYALKKKNSILSKGNEVVVPASGETAEDIARASAIIKQGVILGGDLNIIEPLPSINPEFLALSISNGYPQKVLAQKAQGKSVVHIHNSDIQDLPIAYPLREEQNKIAGLFRHLDHLITLHQRKVELLQNIKKACLGTMFV